MILDMQVQAIGRSRESAESAMNCPAEPAKALMMCVAIENSFAYKTDINEPECICRRRHAATKTPPYSRLHCRSVD